MTPNDQGPIYLETVMGRFPVEPWSTVSNLLFLAIVVFWAWRVSSDLRHHRFIAMAIPVLTIGWVGGTVYHATRSHDAWLFMDFVPIALLVIAVAVLFWRRQGVNWWLVPFLAFGPFVLVRIGFSVLDMRGAWGPMVGYSVLAISILLPVMRYLVRQKWANWPLVAGALGAFILAISFRTLDGRVLVETLPIGTHWLWHGFGAAAVQCLVLYIWRSDLYEAGGSNDEPLHATGARDN